MPEWQFTCENPWYFCEDSPPPLSRVHRSLYRTMSYTSTMDDGIANLNKKSLVCNFMYQTPSSVMKGPQFYCYRDDHLNEHTQNDITHPWIRIFIHRIGDLRAKGPHVVGLWQCMSDDRLKLYLIEICDLLQVADLMNK